MLGVRRRRIDHSYERRSDASHWFMADVRSRCMRSNQDRAFLGGGEGIGMRWVLGTQMRIWHLRSRACPSGKLSLGGALADIGARHWPSNCSFSIRSMAWHRTVGCRFVSYTVVDADIVISNCASAFFVSVNYRTFLGFPIIYCKCLLARSVRRRTGDGTRNFRRMMQYEIRYDTVWCSFL